MNEKPKRKNQISNNPTRISGMRYFILMGLMLCSPILGRWFVFEGHMRLILWFVLALGGIDFCLRLNSEKSRSEIYLLILSLGFFFCFTFFSFVFVPPTKECELESLTVVECGGVRDQFGNAVIDPPYPPYCQWKQLHLASLLVVGGEYEKECYPSG